MAAIGGLRLETGRIGGHAFEVVVWPPGVVPADPDAVRTESGTWMRLRFT